MCVVYKVCPLRHVSSECGGLNLCMNKTHLCWQTSLCRILLQSPGERQSAHIHRRAANRRHVSHVRSSAVQQSSFKLSCVQNTRSVHSFHFQASYLHLSFWRIRCWCQRKRNVIQAWARTSINPCLHHKQQEELEFRKNRKNQDNHIQSWSFFFTCREKVMQVPG